MKNRGVRIIHVISTERWIGYVKDELFMLQ